MIIQSDQVLTKTPQGVNATRSGVGLSSKSYAMLKLFDGSMSMSAFKDLCVGSSMSEADFQATLTELVQLDHLRIDADAAKPVTDAKATAAERRMLLTLDFTVNGEVVPRRVEKPALAPISAVPSNPAVKTAPPVPAPAAVVAAPMASTAPATPNLAVSPLAASDASAEDKTTRLKRETEIRQKLMSTLQPRVEEELRTRLRPKLEQELRPKLIAALRPGIEAEVRTALTNELKPRVELELKARFAKSLAAQKAADQQSARLEAAAPVPTAVPVVPAAADAPGDNLNARLLASLSTPLFSVDKTGVCNYMSPAWGQLSGFTLGDVVGKPLMDFFADGDRRAVAALLAGISNGSALRFDLQAMLARKDGAPVWVEINAAPLTAADGASTGVCGTLRDASELRRAAGQAEADGVRLLLLVDQIDTGVIIEDAEGNIQQANSALCTLLSLDAAPYSLEGMAVSDLLERASRSFIGPDGFLRRVAEIRAVKEDAKGESFVMADGRVIEQDYLVVSVDNDSGGYLWLFREMARSQTRAAS